MLLVFYLGGSNMLGMSHGLGTAGWIAQLAGFFAALPLLLLFGRLVRLMPGTDLYEMLEYTLGKWITAIVSVLYFCYFMILAATTRVYYGVFLQQTSLTNTPLIVILLALFVVCTYLARSGAVSLGKWSTLLVAALVLVAALLALFAIPNMRIEHLLPVAAGGGRAIADGGYRVLFSPFGEAVALLTLLGSLDRKASPYRLFFLGALLAALFFVLTFLRDAAVLGGESMDTLRYPFFQAAGVIRAGAVQTRMEFPASLPFVLAGLTKVAVCLIAAARAVRRSALIPVALFSVGLSALLFYRQTALEAILAVHLYAAPLLQVGIPVLICLVAEVRRKRRPTELEKA